MVVVTITINKYEYTGPGRIEENFSSDFQAALISSSRASFQSSSGKAAFIWNDIQENRVITVSYALEALGKTSANQTVSGKFFYQNQTFNIQPDPTSFTLDVSNLPAYKPVAASNTSTLDDLFSTVTEPSLKMLQLRQLILQLSRHQVMLLQQRIPASRPCSNNQQQLMLLYNKSAYSCRSSSATKHPRSRCYGATKYSCSNCSNATKHSRGHYSCSATKYSCSNCSNATKHSRCHYSCSATNTPAVAAPVQQNTPAAPAPMQQSTPIASTSPAQQNSSETTASPATTSSADNMAGQGGLVYRVQIIVVGDKSKLPRFLRQYKITDQVYYDPC